MYTQQHRLLKVHSPAFAENTFLLTAFSGEEALSKPFEFELTLISQVVDIKADTLLGQTITIVIDTGINAPRVFNGYMVQVLESPHRASGFSEYTIKVVPWFWYSHLTSGTQRFEGKSVVQIFTEVCRGLGCYDFDTRQLHQSYAPVAVVVQYNETVLDFLSRILCEARIDYRFTHTQQRKHKTLILNWFRAKGSLSSGPVEGLNNKAKLTIKKAYGFKTLNCLQIALYHQLGRLNQPPATHTFC